jgi:hypothetical protein
LLRGKRRANLHIDPGYAILISSDESCTSRANIKAVPRMLGHASASITLDVYADLFDDDLDAVAVALDNAAMKSTVAKVLPRSRFTGPAPTKRKARTPVND